MYEKEKVVESQAAILADEITKKIVEIPFGDQNEVCKQVCRNIRSFRMKRIEGLDQEIHNIKCEVEAMIKFNKELEILD